jgi:hypothetical protein
MEVVYGFAQANSNGVRCVVLTSQDQMIGARVHEAAPDSRVANRLERVQRTSELDVATRPVHPL